MGLTRTTVSGTAWTYGIFALGKGLVFLSTILLARLLVPQDFGLVALGLLVLRFLEKLGDLGVGQALIYRADDTDRTSSVAFGINLFMGLALTAGTVLAAPLAAEYFREPQLAPVLQVLALSVLLTALRNVHESRLKRELEFRRRFVPEIARTAAKGVVSVVFAWLGFGVWSLVWGQLVGEITSTVLYWWVARWRPRLAFDPTTARSLLGYGGQIVVLSLISATLNNVDYLIIGRRLDAVALGFYVMAFRVPELVIVSLCTVASQVLFPAYARLQSDAAAMRRGYLKTMRYMALITVPAAVGMAIVAADFVNLFYTARWSPSVPVMRFLALYSMFQALSVGAGSIYKAVGRPSILSALGAAKLVVAIPVLWIAAGHGILAVAVGHAITTLVFTLISLGIACRVLNVRWRDVASALRPAFTSTAAMAVGALAIQRVLPPPIRLWGVALMGLALYALTLWLTERATIQQALTLIRRPGRAAIS